MTFASMSPTYCTRLETLCALFSYTHCPPWSRISVVFPDQELPEEAFFPTIQLSAPGMGADHGADLLLPFSPKRKRIVFHRCLHTPVWIFWILPSLKFFHV